MSQTTPRVIAKYGQSGDITALAFSPDGGRLATVSSDGEVQIRAVNDGSLVSKFRAAGPLRGVAFAPNGTLAVVTGTGNVPQSAVIAFDPATAVKKWSLNIFEGRRCIFTPDGSGVLLLWGPFAQMLDPQTGVKRWEFKVANTQVIGGASISFDSATVAIGVGSSNRVDGGQIVLLNASSGVVNRRIDRATNVQKLSFSTKRGLLVFGADDEIGVVDMTSNALRVLPNPDDPANPASRLRIVWSIAFSPDDQLIGVATSARTGSLATIDVLDTATFDLRQELTKVRMVLGPLVASSAMVVFGFSPDSRSALSAENSADVRVWDVTTGVEQFKLLHSGSGINAAAFGPTGVTAAVASGNIATLLELPAPERFAFNHDGPVSAVRFSVDGSQVLTGSQDGTARVFDATTGTQQTRLPHDGPVNSVAWLPANPWVATASADHTARIFDPATATERTRIQHDGPVYAVAVSADGQRLASAADDAVVRITDVATGSVLRSFNHNGPVRAVAFSPDGSRLATGSDDSTARVFNAATGAKLMTLPHGAAVVAVAFNPDGSQLATGCADNSARVFNPASGAQACNVTCAGPVRAVVFSPDGSQLAVGSDDTSARIVRADTGAELHHFTHGGAVQALAYQPAGKLLVTGSADATARVFDTGTGTQLRSFTHDGAVHAVSVDPAGTTLATASEDKTARVWDIPKP